jgi:ribonuclease D
MSDTENLEVEPTLVTLANPRVSDVRLVETVESLHRGIADILLGEGALAVDAERASGFKYSQRAYLIQLFRSGGPILLIDPIAITAEDPKAFSWMQDQLVHLEWIIHAASQDIPCLAELGLRPKFLFDTELAGRLAGFDRVGLGSMVARCLGFQLAKEHSAVDWSTRPLNASWLTYAALDVDVLPELRDALENELRSQGKLEWAAEEFRVLTGFEQKAPKQDKWRGLSGLSAVKDQRQLAIARSMWTARETLAQKLDVSPSRLLPDSSIVEAVTAKTRSRAELNANRKFAGRASRSYIDLWWSAYESGASTNQLPELRMQATGMPNHRSWPNKFPEADARLSLLRAAMASLSEVHKMPPENILSPELVRTLAWENCEASTSFVAQRLLELGARQWQIELASSALADSIVASKP